MEEDGFHIATKEASLCLESAGKLSEWVQCNKDNAERMYSAIADMLTAGCITNSTYRARNGLVALNRLQLWTAYHKLTLSHNFSEKWVALFEAAEAHPHPMLYQFMTQKLVDHLIFQKFPVSPVNSDTVEELSDMELNALRYVCGYVIRAVESKIEKSSHSMKESFIFSLGCMKEVELSENVEGCSSSDWLETVDRGGLIHVSQDCFRFFFSMEMEVRKYFQEQGETLYGEKKGKDLVKEAVCRDVDVLYYWDMCHSELEDDAEKCELLQLVVAHYITIRGFSFARSIVEKFKRSNKKTVQKSKGLRKKINSS